MSSPALTAGQYSIGRDDASAPFVYGGRPGTISNNIWVQNTATDTGTVNVQDQTVVGHDGQLFGVDTMPGMVITQTGYAMTSPGSGAAAMDSYSALAGVWNDPYIRLTDGYIQVFRACYPGSNVTRRCYGRGRKILPTYGQVNQGIVPFTAQFQCGDNIWYEDTSSSIVLTMVPSLFGGGITPPVTPPYHLTSQTNYQQNVINNTGSLPTWPVISLKGPISYPTVTYVNTPVSIGYNGSLASNQTLVIDTRPWVRTAMIGNTSVAGALTGDPMISLQAWPGTTLVKLNGQDFTGTSTCTITWRSATLAIGGSA